MKHMLLSLPLILALLPGCQGNATRTQSSPKPADDFNPLEPHPFLSRQDNQQNLILDRDLLNLQNDSTGNLRIGTIRVVEAAIDSFQSRITHLAFISKLGQKGNASFEYNEYNELTRLQIEEDGIRTNCALEWNDDGNVESITREVSGFDSLHSQPRHTITILQMHYSTQSAFGNWYCGMAENIGGSIAEVLHTGLAGRSSWHIPSEVVQITTDIEGNMISEQSTIHYQPTYTSDANGRVIKESFGPEKASQTYTYTY